MACDRHHRATALVAVCLCALASLGSAAPSPERRTPVVVAVEHVSPAVVSVSVQTMVDARNGAAFDWFFRDFGEGHRRRLETVSQGSGVIIDAAGYVLTNYHVIAAGGEIAIEIADAGKLEAEVVGTAPDHDLAVLRVKAQKPLPNVPMGTSHDLMIGEPVIAIGNPFGLSHTVTTGVVSALHRTLQTEERTYLDFIQTDASINPGNSGGPLLNIEGQLIGVNTAIYSKAQGIGFAIPIDKARRIVSDLLRFGEVRRPYFGFDLQDLTPELAESFAARGAAGVLVADVDNKGPAAEKLREGDLIDSFEGMKVADAEELRSRLGDLNAGARALLGVQRGGQASTVEVQAAVLSPEEALRRVQTKTGIKAVELSADEARRARLPGKTLVVETVAPGSPAHRLGLRRGDWIRAVNAEKVSGMDAFGKAMARSYWRGQVILLIQRGRLWQQVAFDL